MSEVVQFSSEAKKLAGGILRDVWKHADDMRKRWADQAKEICKYGYSPDYNFEYQGLPAAAFFRAKVGLTSEAIRVFGPYLYQANPHRTATVRPWAAPSSANSATVVGDYLNWSISQYDAYGNGRRMVDDAVSTGRGVLWTGVYSRKDTVIGSFYDSAFNLWSDGDAQVKEDIRCKFRRRVRPRSELIAEYPEAEKILKDLPVANAKDDPSQLTFLKRSAASQADDVEIMEGYFIVGLNQFKGGSQLNKQMQKDEAELPEQPLKYIFTKDGKFIAACEWECPLWIDGLWPCTELDFYDYPAETYPVSPLEPGIGYQRAINWIITLIMGRARTSMRFMGALINQAGEGLNRQDEDKLLIGRDAEWLQVQASGGKAIGDYVQEIKMSNDFINPGIALANMFEDRYNKATGKYDILYYGSTETQSRTATDAQMKDRNSRSRIEDMREKILSAASSAARKEAMYSRWLMDSEKITTVLGPEAGAAWGFLSANPEQEMADMARQLTKGGVIPEQALAFAQEKFANAISFTDWANETEYTVEADSMRRKDVDQKIDTFNELANQTVPTLLQSMEPAMRSQGMRILAMQQEALGSDRRVVDGFNQLADALMAQPPPPPPGMEPPGPPGPPRP